MRNGTWTLFRIFLSSVVVSSFHTQHTSILFILVPYVYFYTYGSHTHTLSIRVKGRFGSLDSLTLDSLISLIAGGSLGQCMEKLEKQRPGCVIHKEHYTIIVYLANIRLLPNNGRLELVHGSAGDSCEIISLRSIRVEQTSSLQELLIDEL